jgi:hypothetical protein
VVSAATTVGPMDNGDIWHSVPPQPALEGRHQTAFGRRVYYLYKCNGKTKLHDLVSSGDL